MSRINETSVIRTFSQQDFDQFAILSGDDNPIHTDAEFSKHSRFGRTVAHGLLLCSVLRALTEQLVPGCRLSEQSVMFPAPTYAGEPMRFTVFLTDTRMADNKTGGAHEDLGVVLEVRRISDETMTCQGQARVLI